MESQSADNKQFIDFQSSTKYFFDTSATCFDHCIKGFENKELSLTEKNCVNQCFTKQMVVFGSL
jgi:hypothetical protein